MKHDWSNRASVLAAAMLCLLPAPALAAPLVADGGFAATPYREGACKSDLGLLNQIGGWQTSWPAQWTAAADLDGAALAEAAARWSAAPAALDAAIAQLTDGVAEGRTAPKPVVRRVAQQVDDLIAALDARDPKYFGAAEAGRLGAWRAMLSGRMAPALRAYAAYLKGPYLTAAAEAPSLAAAGAGPECFESAVEWWTTLSLTAAEIRAAGEESLEDNRAALKKTLKRGVSVSEGLRFLRGGDQFREATRAEIVAVSEAALARAQAAAPRFFLDGWKTPIIVEPMPAYLEPSAPAGFYRPGEGGAASAYIINASRPADRRLMAEAIAFHEGLPGHHLQFSYPKSGEGAGFNAGYTEGWAIYAEYLADEMGLYASVVDRQGMIAKHLWAASRLVVEPGLQTGGWSRDDAIDFMMANTALAREEIEIEVDRYIAMPGQSLAYMLGFRAFASARDKAAAELGDAFDIRAFHDRILRPGPRPIPVVMEDIERWASEKGS